MNRELCDWGLTLTKELEDDKVASNNIFVICTITSVREVCSDLQVYR